MQTRAKSTYHFIKDCSDQREAVTRHHTIVSAWRAGQPVNWTERTLMPLRATFATCATLTLISSSVHSFGAFPALPIATGFLRSLSRASRTRTNASTSSACERLSASSRERLVASERVRVVRVRLAEGGVASEGEERLPVEELSGTRTGSASVRVGRLGRRRDSRRCVWCVCAVQRVYE